MGRLWEGIGVDKWCNSFADKVQNWLEEGDSEFERIFAYSICLAATTFVVARLFIE
ncbi:MAG: hypothetical protein GX325_01175 [Peptococcaceae bacterium]|nr:hypothetical protein [Peptococcaceae bacterium]